MQDAEHLDMSKTYFYDGNECVLTGRTATRTIKHENRRTRRRQNQPETPEETIEVMVEISPVSELRAPGGFTECQWVKANELFLIRNRLYDDYENDEDDEDDDDDYEDGETEEEFNLG